MMKFRAVPVGVEAMEFEGNYESGRRIREAFGIERTSFSADERVLLLPIGSANARVVRGDFVVRHEGGEIAVVKPGPFALAYEPADEAAHAFVAAKIAAEREAAEAAKIAAEREAAEAAEANRKAAEAEETAARERREAVAAEREAAMQAEVAAIQQREADAAKAAVDALKGVDESAVLILDDNAEAQSDRA